MSDVRKIAIAFTAWIIGITALHGALNVDWSILLNDRLPHDKRKLNVAYIPVT